MMRFWRLGAIVVTLGLFAGQAHAGAPRVRFDTDAMRAAADSPYLAATDLAEQLVVRGVPFREAHAIVGGLVRDSIERHVPLGDLVAAHPAFEEADRALVEPGASVARRTSPGGASASAVAPQLKRFRARVLAAEERIGG